MRLFNKYMVCLTVNPSFISFLVVFFFTEKNYLMSSLAMSVRPSVRLSVCPSSVEISLERGCSITNMPIDLKFGPIIGGGVMHV